MLQVESWTRDRRAEWDRLIAGEPVQHFFHSSPWSEVLCSAYGFETFCLVFRHLGRIVALLPITEVRGGRRAVSLPFADECPPLVTTSSTVDLLEPLIEIGRQRNWAELEVRGTCAGFHSKPPSLTFFGHDVTLDADPAAMLARMKGPVRTAIRKSESTSVRIETTDACPALREFYGLYQTTRRRHGLPPQPWSFFSAIHEHILQRGLGKIFLARQNGKAIAGALFFQNGLRVLFKYGVSDNRFQELRANNAVMWSAMKWYGQMGCTLLSMGRTSRGNEGLRRFKLGWGSAESTIAYVKYNFRQARFVAEKDQASGPHNWIFRRAPLWFSNLAGRILYKHWA